MIRKITIINLYKNVGSQRAIAIGTIERFILVRNYWLFIIDDESVDIFELWLGNTCYTLDFEREAT